jgi:lipopolysaccharide/colanic/teichoic acid biosynthesis glycosyltransferase
MIQHVRRRSRNPMSRRRPRARLLIRRHLMCPRPAAAQSGPRPAGMVTRLIDVSGASVLLVVLAPVLVLIAVLVRSTSPGPALFRQVRLGYHLRPFVMLKFRTMRAGSDDGLHRDFVGRMLRGEDPRRAGSHGLYKLADDTRVTRVGQILRSTSLDELPQLVNVLRGEMSLVGPRPALAWEAEFYQPHHHERFQVKPGITGLWQVSGRSRLTMNQALDLDAEYARRRSVALDLLILARTLPAVFHVGAAR